MITYKAILQGSLVFTNKNATLNQLKLMLEQEFLALWAKKNQDCQRDITAIETVDFWKGFWVNIVILIW